MKGFKILEKYKDANEIWHSISLKKCIDLTEGSGYWKKDSVKSMLIDNQIVFTPFADYKIEN